VNATYADAAAAAAAAYDGGGDGEMVSHIYARVKA
jgi:hypothetical protein